MKWFHSYVCECVILGATRSDSDRWRIHVLVWVKTDSPLVMCIFDSHVSCMYHAVTDKWKHNLKLYFHFYVYVYLYVSVSHQDRLEDMKCFHWYLCNLLHKKRRKKKKICMCASSIWITAGTDSDGWLICLTAWGIV